MPGRALTSDELCERYAGRVYKFAQMISEDSASAEDLAQDALERALRGLKTFDPTKGEIQAWLWRIVVNASRDAGRIARREQLVIETLADRWGREDTSVSTFDLRTDEVWRPFDPCPPAIAHRSLCAMGQTLLIERLGWGLESQKPLLHRDGCRCAR